MRLFLVRHGESEKNIGDQFDKEDDTDDKLTLRGEEEIERVARYVLEIASPLTNCILITDARRRSIESAERLSLNLSCPYRIEKALRPISPGDLSGMSYDEAMAKYPDLMRKRILFSKNLISGYTLTFPNGDSLDVYESRMKSWLRDILAKYRTYENIIMISHRSEILAALNIFNKALSNQKADSYKYYQTPPGCIVEIKLDSLRPTFIVLHGGIGNWGKN